MMAASSSITPHGRRDGPLCIAVADAARPQGPYTDRGPLVCQDAGSIDAMPIRDENGRRYLVWKEDGNSRKLPDAALGAAAVRRRHRADR